MMPDGQCMLRRVISNEGRSRAYINGRPVPVATQRELGDLLVDIHGQHEHQSLLRRDVQRLMLDQHGDCGELQAQVAQLANQWAALQDELSGTSGPSADRDARLELLRYQLDELDAFAPVEAEVESLEQELRRLTNVTTLLDTCNHWLEQLGGLDERSALDMLRSAARELQELPDDDRGLRTAAEMLDTAGIQLQEAVNDIRTYVRGLEPDPARVDDIEHRLSAAHDLARKHRVATNGLVQLRQQLADDISALEASEARVAEIEAELQAVHGEYGQAAESLHRARSSAAKRLSQAVGRELAVLGMQGAVFNISVEPEDDHTPRAHGWDRIEFAVSTNPGQPSLPLARVASGGELSRISLALQVVTAGGTGVPTVIFDEVDAGIGGQVAETVGTHMHGLGEHRQVLCVTHLPQVASQADAHVQVHKKSSKTRVQTRFEPLAGERRIEEIARMLGGLEITAQTRAHAREMLSRD